MLQIISTLVAVAGLAYAAYQIRLSRNATMAGVLLQIEQLLADHGEVHSKLRPGGVWASPGAGPSTPEEWITVEVYMGLLERIGVLVDKGLLDLDVVASAYGYRMGNLVANERIRTTKLEGEARSWQSFLSLWEKVRARRL
jgi:hypothetical protein